jgi:hypothetical protein
MQLSAPRVPLRIRPWHPARGLCGIRPVASGPWSTHGWQAITGQHTRNRSANCRPVVSGSVARAVHCITAGGMADLADCRNIYGWQHARPRAVLRAGDCHWPGDVSRPNCGAPLTLPLPAPASLPLGAFGLPAIGFLARFRFGLQLPAPTFTLQPRSACSAALVSRQDYLRAAYRCFAVQARYVKLPQLPSVACQYRGAYRQALQCAERMFVDFRLNGQVKCRRPVRQLRSGDNRSAWEFAPLFGPLVTSPQCGHTPQHIVHARARWLGFGFGVNVLPIRLWCNVLANDCGVAVTSWPTGLGSGATSWLGVRELVRQVRSWQWPLG